MGLKCTDLVSNEICTRTLQEVQAQTKPMHEDGLTVRSSRFTPESLKPDQYPHRRLVSNRLVLTLGYYAAQFTWSRARPSVALILPSIVLTSRRSRQKELFISSKSLTRFGVNCRMCLHGVIALEIPRILQDETMQRVS